MYYLKTEHTFDSAHFLKDYDGKCRNIHGHCWRVVCWIRSKDLQENGMFREMILDFSDLKACLKNLCDSLDHCLIYERGSLKPETVKALEAEAFKMVEVPFRPTAEQFAKWFYQSIKDTGMPVFRIEVYETEKNCAVYDEEEDAGR